mmetsp:Transcript_18200/g.47339  ORF Transcript_18200/g.47339 Transcript_18200/m.47339 type:complete len:144 (+) Transcript_18200:869-1300(+)
MRHHSTARMPSASPRALCVGNAHPVAAADVLSQARRRQRPDEAAGKWRPPPMPRSRQPQPPQQHWRERKSATTLASSTGGRRVQSRQKGYGWQQIEWGRLPLKPTSHGSTLEDAGCMEKVAKLVERKVREGDGAPWRHPEQQA